jgi:hypothetical protein
MKIFYSNPGITSPPINPNDTKLINITTINIVLGFERYIFFRTKDIVLSFKQIVSK